MWPFQIMSVTVYVTQQFYLSDIRWKAAENPLLDCAIKIFLYLFKQLWCLTKNTPIERIEIGAIFTKGEGDTQFSVNTNMQIRSTEISYKSKSQNLAFRSTNLRSFEGQNSLRYVSVTSCLGSIMRCFQFFHVSSPSGKGASYEPPTPLGNLCLWTPSPSEFPVTSRGGGGMDIFWNHTIWLFHICAANG